jgi:hypothetical protein
VRVWNGHTAYRYSHAKRDGWRLRVEIRNEIYFWTSGFNRVYLSESHLEALAQVPHGVDLLCELWKPGEHASYISTGIAERDPDMRLDVFSVCRVSTDLEGAKEICDGWGLHFIEFLPGMGHPIMEHAEGWVFKNDNIDEGVKYKPFRDVTLRVVGVTPGKGKYDGLIGSFEVALSDGTVIADVSGMDDSVRALPVSDLVGRLVDVTYQKVNSRGRLRHANFVRFRDDKGEADERV